VHIGWPLCSGRMRAAEVMRRRLDVQCISATTMSRPADVVARLGAVQAQDYLGALWAVGLRLSDATEHAVERALADRTIVRTWPMRGTLHFVAAADARWMVELLGPRIVTRAAGRLRVLGLDDTTLARARRALVLALEGGRTLTRPALYQVLERAKVSTAGQRGLHILWRLAHDCFLCFGPRQGKQQTFVLFDEWLPAAKPRQREEALAALAERYFMGHGPATAADFAWWAGLALGDARRAVHLAKSALEEERVDGRPVWVARSSTTPRVARAKAYLLPAFDELLVGYADRSAAVDAAQAFGVNAGGGILKPTVVVDGRVVGTWKRALAPGGVAFSPTWFDDPSAQRMARVARAFHRYASFLGRKPL
jgi:hypothetical protein